MRCMFWENGCQWSGNYSELKVGGTVIVYRMILRGGSIQQWECLQLLAMNKRYQWQSDNSVLIHVSRPILVKYMLSSADTLVVYVFTIRSTSTVASTISVSCVGRNYRCMRYVRNYSLFILSIMDISSKFVLSLENSLYTCRLMPIKQVHRQKLWSVSTTV